MLEQLVDDLPPSVKEVEPAKAGSDWEVADLSDPAEVPVKCTHCDALVTVRAAVWKVFPAVTCPRCLGLYFERRAEREAAQHGRVPSRSEQFEERCPPKYLETEHSKLPDPANARTALRWEYGSKGLVLHGETGSGKTRTIWMILRKAFLDGKSFLYYSGNDFDRACKAAGGSQKEEAFMESLTGQDLIVFDDMGNEKPSARSETILLDVFRHREEWQKPILVTTQFVGAELGAPSRWANGNTGAAMQRRLSDRDIFLPIRLHNRSEPEPEQTTLL